MAGSGFWMQPVNRLSGGFVSIAPVWSHRTRLAQRRWAVRRGALLQRGKSTGNVPDIEFTGLRSESDEAQ
jgi:hypothetical protein